MSTFALALVVDSLIIELRGPLALIMRGCYYGFGSAEVRGDRGGGAPTESEAWFERWLDAASLGAMRRRGGAPYAVSRAWGTGWAWLAYWANVDDHSMP
mmetsp:Transcript_21914/g.54249  ORF Transcript_21914/g.54249 Transcript_21914/m.54249 type:complete len:99 (+) Transcript_21914:373-669(+)